MIIYQFNRFLAKDRGIGRDLVGLSVINAKRSSLFYLIQPALAGSITCYGMFGLRSFPYKVMN
ncbi:hypothetical protein [Photobacterium leiognathi]|uniref:hypothetical protein n=1 Tax=Photobacterium leiognathi TaxID=553611 RepID=UPI003AF36784